MGERSHSPASNEDRLRARSKGKAPVRMGRMDDRAHGPKVDVSHEVLKDNLRGSKDRANQYAVPVGVAADGPHVQATEEFSDINNNMNLRPNNLPFDQSGLKAGINSQSTGMAVKGIKRINQEWAAEEVIELMDTFVSDHSSISKPLETLNGQNGGRPPDPTRVGISISSLSCPSRSCAPSLSTENGVKLCGAGDAQSTERGSTETTMEVEPTVGGLEDAVPVTLNL